MWLTLRPDDRHSKYLWKVSRLLPDCKVKISEVGHIHTGRCENLKSQILQLNNARGENNTAQHEYILYTRRSEDKHVQCNVQKVVSCGRSFLRSSEKNHTFTPISSSCQSCKIACLCVCRPNITSVYEYLRFLQRFLEDQHRYFISGNYYVTK